MQIIGIHGFDEKQTRILYELIDLCMQAIVLRSGTFMEAFFSQVLSCEANITFKPYLQVFTDNPENIPLILAGFQKHKIHHNVAVVPDLFFEGSEIASGKWREKVLDKIRVASNRGEMKVPSLMCLDGQSLCEPSKKPKGFCNRYRCGG